MVREGQRAIEQCLDNSGASSVSRSTRLAAISPTMVCVFAVLHIADLERELRLRDERIRELKDEIDKGRELVNTGPHGSGAP